MTAARDLMSSWIRLSAYHSVDIQWGNHDVVWMGAASRADGMYGDGDCGFPLVTAILDTLEEGYGINLIPLATFAHEVPMKIRTAACFPSNTGAAL